MQVVTIIIFLTLDELRRHGPERLRPWLERRMATLKKGPGTVVEFHAASEEDGP